MGEVLKRFMDHVNENNLLVYYAQVRQDGKEVDFWSRFIYGMENNRTGFRGLTRLESYSTAKSISAAGIGIALDQGLITLDEKLADSFPECTYDIDASSYVFDITVEDLLKMSSGMSEPLFFRDSPERKTVRDWPRYFFEKGNFVYPPGEKFLYSNFCTYMAGCLVEKKAGMNLLEYMRFRLFEPLGIGNPDMTMCPMGHTIAANGMDINIDEMGRFGEMMLNKGIYNGKRILSEEFADKALSPLLITDKPLYSARKDGWFDYGYQFWVDSENNCSLIGGILGQMCVIIPDKKAVVTIQSMDQNVELLGKFLWEDVIFNL